MKAVLLALELAGWAFVGAVAGAKSLPAQSCSNCSSPVASVAQATR